MARVNEDLWQTLQPHEVKHFEYIQELFVTANPDGKCELWKLKYLGAKYIGLLLYDVRLSDNDWAAYIPCDGIDAETNMGKGVRWLVKAEFGDAFIRLRDSMGVPAYSACIDTDYCHKMITICAAAFRDIVSERHL